MAWAEEVAEAFGPVLPEGLPGEPAEGPTEGGPAGDGDEAPYDDGFGPLTATVPSESWTRALTLARDSLGCTFFDWLSAVDELERGFSVLCHVARLPTPADPSVTGRGDSPEAPQTSRGGTGVRHLLVRTRLPREDPRLPSVADVYAGASWHERETAEMFGIAFVSTSPAAEQAPTAPPEASQAGPETRHLLLPEEFEGHPLRKDFVLASRVVKPFPGAKEPGESDEGGGSPSRRRTRPPGVPDPESWGPREPGSAAPDPLAHAQPGAARPRRAARERPARRQEQSEQPEQTERRETGPESPDG